MESFCAVTAKAGMSPMCIKNEIKYYYYFIVSLLIDGTLSNRILRMILLRLLCHFQSNAGFWIILTVSSNV